MSLKKRDVVPGNKISPVTIINYPSFLLFCHELFLLNP